MDCEGAALVAHGRRKGGPGGRDASLVLLEAPCVSANLLPVTRFVSKGFLTKCLGQVDLRLTPLNLA
ncbi:hypothetical protein K040078D81_33030 [Blautia hominis]|uniref:Uncharacterized protein n=1 Tax=Blautia hominis TaxID=2025493 RepID=A0ABQ0BCL4_9FIRM